MSARLWKQLIYGQVNHKIDLSDLVRTQTQICPLGRSLIGKFYIIRLKTSSVFLIKGHAELEQFLIDQMWDKASLVGVEMDYD